MSRAREELDEKGGCHQCGQQIERNHVAGQAGPHQVDEPGQVDFAALAHGRELRRRGFVAAAHQRIDGRSGQVFAHQRHQLMVLLPLSGEGDVHGVFDTIPIARALLHERCRDVTQTYAIES